MLSRNIVHPVAIVLTAVLFTSCAVTNVPPRWLPEAEQTPTSVYGGWIEIKTLRWEVMGELIAVTKDTVFVADYALRSIAVRDIFSARLVTYNESIIGAYVFLGLILSITNGWFILFTGLIWIIGGLIAGANRSFDPIIDFPEKPIFAFQPHARYPQGIPTEVDRSTIRIKTAYRSRGNPPSNSPQWEER